jgi:hypothetical protein
MSAPHGVESVPTPAVSSLRSRFEQLAVDSTIKLPSNGRLTADPPSPRPRAASGSSGVQPDNPRSETLRTSSSSSDLKGSKRPPPPPPIRASPNATPLLRPTHISSSPSLSHIAAYGSTPNLLNMTPMKKPPPPPPPSANKLGSVLFNRSYSPTNSRLQIQLSHPPSLEAP